MRLGTNQVFGSLASYWLFFRCSGPYSCFVEPGRSRFVLARGWQRLEFRTPGFVFLQARTSRRFWSREKSLFAMMHLRESIITWRKGMRWWWQLGALRSWRERSCSLRA